MGLMLWDMPSVAWVWLFGSTALELNGDRLPVLRLMGLID